ncbi:outer membrane protein transport protein [Vibrio sp. CAU 1672]|uniref:OmpP1/FadL family transporter n=1 Tax=Vibrio sp. CAU 1672 TaxID=3032594 RepID=UPI0023DAAA82|nr:outer membrane protein transport protein [Vibrio sp. CAU 1672]MDF2153543.1 outer membrane protein transport protein [Vibrio sp. CAU 1672]
MSLTYPRLSALALAIISCHSHAAATLVSEMSHLNVGTAGAGSAVSADGASTAYSNPAAMGYLKDTHLAFNLASMALNIEYQDDREQALSSGNAGGIQPYGSLYALTPLSENINFGMAMVATGGSGLDYGNSYAGRLGLNDLQLSVLQLNPSLSYKVNARWNLGVGVQIDRAAFEQRFLSQRAALESTSLAFGYNLGATYQLNQQHRFGVTYRSKMEHQLEGELSLLNRQMDMTIDLINAARLELSGHHQLTPPIALVWSVGQEYWSANDASLVQAGNIEGTMVRGFDDIWFAAIGSKIELTPKLGIEMGVGYVSSPLDDATLQSPDLPVERQLKYSIGGDYQWSTSTTIKTYYSYVDYGNPEIDNGLLQGRYDNHNHFFGLELDYRF